jgi:hypothetical protein
MLVRFRIDNFLVDLLMFEFLVSSHTVAVLLESYGGRSRPVGLMCVPSLHQTHLSMQITCQDPVSTALTLLLLPPARMSNWGPYRPRAAYNH